MPQSGWPAWPQGSRTGQLQALDFDVPQTISFEGVETLVLASAGTEEEHVVVTRHENAITAAERDGVRHIVYTSLTVARDDLAEAAAIIARNPEKHQGKTYNLVGNTVITAQDLADTVGAEYRPGTTSPTALDGNPSTHSTLPPPPRPPDEQGVWQP